MFPFANGVLVQKIWRFFKWQLIVESIFPNGKNEGGSIRRRTFCYEKKCQLGEVNFNFFCLWFNDLLSRCIYHINSSVSKNLLSASITPPKKAVSKHLLSATTTSTFHQKKSKMQNTQTQAPARPALREKIENRKRKIHRENHSEGEIAYVQCRAETTNIHLPMQIWFDWKIMRRAEKQSKTRPKRTKLSKACKTNLGSRDPGWKKNWPVWVGRQKTRPYTLESNKVTHAIVKTICLF